jgi:hypothetical protein
MSTATGCGVWLACQALFGLVGGESGSRRAELVKPICTMQPMPFSSSSRSSSNCNTNRKIHVQVQVKARNARMKFKMSFFISE